MRERERGERERERERARDSRASALVCFGRRALARSKKGALSALCREKDRERETYIKRERERERERKRAGRALARSCAMDGALTL